MMRAVLAAVCAIASACGGGDPPFDGCPHGVPPLSACFVGNFFADCRGEGESRFACDADNRCMWFPGGCVAAGFTASTCPADDICCHDNWPFEEDNSDYTLINQLHSLGTLPWDQSTAAVLSVAVDPLLTAPETSITCDGDLGLAPRNPCNDPECGAWFTRMPDTLVAISAHCNSIVGWSAGIEILPVETGLTARLCADQYTDLVRPQCDESFGRERTCATAGAITIDRWPATALDAAGMVVAFDVTFANGMRMQGTLVDPL